MIDLRSDTITESIHCCQQMKAQVDLVCELHQNPFDCPDSLIYYSKPSGEYGLIIHDGGSSFLKIDFCPFCGKSLFK